MSRTVAFTGLGQMGGPMAAGFAKTGQKEGTTPSWKSRPPEARSQGG